MPKITFVVFLRRILLCLIILVIHYVFVFLPISELFFIYIIFVKPKWFQDF
jgi:hypothetical protein